MSSKKATQGSETVDQVSIEAPDFSPQSNHDSSSDNEQDEQDDISQSDSDSLDNAQTTFAALGVKPWLVGSLGAMAIKRPTGIQKGCIPEILKGRDCIGGSRTGSGKTVAFAVPILQKWAEDPFGIFALVLTPTRELALQIYEQFKAISSPQSLKAVLITGGSDMRPQATALAQRPHVVIATPGRLADHIRTSGEDTYALCVGVGSMLPDVEECLSIPSTSAERQTLLFTATVTPEVRALKDMPRTPGSLQYLSAKWIRRLWQFLLP
ncbi:hypothetical protein DID88_004836 [Monilinia fructigena]|uniref:Helicase ATP-binding domain-containing protein n=1 Tax=Monilinia fructigena TaxID=38457 RepID=A0A395IV97_9HELO|nr:hypothetical protein DID88_004836 [Monilinia fructigena]